MFRVFGNLFRGDTWNISKKFEFGMFLCLLFFLVAANRIWWQERVIVSLFIITPKRVFKLFQIERNVLVAKHKRIDALAYDTIDGRTVRQLHEQDETLAKKFFHAFDVEQLFKEIVERFSDRVFSGIC